MRYRRDQEGEQALGFFPVEVVRRLATLSALTVVPGAQPPIAGIALADGAVVTVLSLGEPPGPLAAQRSLDAFGVVPGADRAVLCRVGGIDVALTGGTVLATGVFGVAPDGESVLWRGEVVPEIDVRALYAQAEAATWAPRAGHPAERPRALRDEPPSQPHARVSEAGGWR